MCQHLSPLTHRCLNMPFSIDISPLRGEEIEIPRRNVQNPLIATWVKTPIPSRLLHRSLRLQPQTQRDFGSVS